MPHDWRPSARSHTSGQSSRNFRRIPHRKTTANTSASNYDKSQPTLTANDQKTTFSDDRQQPLCGDELRAIHSWLKERSRLNPAGKTFFVSGQRMPLHRSTVNLALRKYSATASLPLLAHPHMLRHACGFALDDQGEDTRLIQDYLGHRSIQHTVRYTASNTARFVKLWRQFR